jgi:hypothetical protein
VVIRSRALRSLPHGNFKAGIVKTLFIDDIVKRAGLFLVARVVWALAILAGQTVYEGLVTGCVKAKYGWHWQTRAPILYVGTIVFTGIACGCSISIGALFAILALRHPR